MINNNGTNMLEQLSARAASFREHVLRSLEPLSGLQGFEAFLDLCSGEAPPPIFSRTVYIRPAESAPSKNSAVATTLICLGFRASEPEINVLTHGGFPQIKLAILGVLIVRSIVYSFCGPYCWGPPTSGNYHMSPRHMKLHAVACKSKYATSQDNPRTKFPEPHMMASIVINSTPFLEASALLSGVGVSSHDKKP